MLGKCPTTKLHNQPSPKAFHIMTELHPAPRGPPPLWNSTSTPSWLSFEDADPFSNCSFSSFFTTPPPSPSLTAQAFSLCACQSLRAPAQPAAVSSQLSNIGSLWERYSPQGDMVENLEMLLRSCIPNDSNIFPSPGLFGEFLFLPIPYSGISDIVYLACFPLGDASVVLGEMA